MELLLLVVLNAVQLKLVTKLKSSVLSRTRKAIVTGVEMFRKLLDQAQAGDNIGTLLRGIDKNDIERGMVLAKPGSILRIKNSKQKCMSCQKKKVDVILLSSVDTVLSSISVQLTLPVV